MSSLVAGRRQTAAMLDPVLLRTFLVIAEGHSFSETSRKLELRQSTVSDHVRRLEQHLGRQLFVRDTHSVVLTADGEALIGYARLILETADRAEKFFAGTRTRGRLRFGTTEDLVLTFLPDVLEGFTRDHPDTDLELTVALSSNLMQRFDDGDLDLVFCKRWAGEDRGELVWRDQLVWRGRPDEWRRDMIRGGGLPLISYPPPSVTRAIALETLSRADIGWRFACTSDTLSGLVAATRAGLGIMVISRSLAPDGLVELPPDALPDLGMLDFVLLRHSRRSRAPVAELAAAIMSRTRGLAADDTRIRLASSPAPC